MTPHKGRESFSRLVRPVFQPFKDLFKTPPRNESSVAAQVTEPSSPSLVPGLHLGLLTPGPTPDNKRKLATSAPPSPTSNRPTSKRPRLKIPLTFFSSKFGRSAQDPTPIPAPGPHTLVPPRSGTTLDAAADYERDRISLQRSCQASRSADSLASDRGRARASARASDESDANRVLKLIKELKSESYKVEKVGPGGKYLIQRKLQRHGYRLLQKKLAEEDKRSKGKDQETLQKYVKLGLR